MVHLRRSKKMEYCVSLSGFPKEEQIILIQQIKKLGGKYLHTRSFERDCTHLVCGTLMRSEKYIGACITGDEVKIIFSASRYRNRDKLLLYGPQVMALKELDPVCARRLLWECAFQAMGTWILSKKFIQDSCKVGKWLDESNYEFSVLDPSQQRDLVEAAKRWRWKIENYQEYPFSGWNVACVMDTVLKDAFERLFRYGGATVEQVQFPLTQENIPNVTYILMDPSCKQYAASLQEFGILCLSYDFLSDFVIKENSDPFDYVIKGDGNCEAIRVPEPLDTSPLKGGPRPVRCSTTGTSSTQSLLGGASTVGSAGKGNGSLCEIAGGEEEAPARRAKGMPPGCSQASDVKCRQNDAGVAELSKKQHGNSVSGLTELKSQQIARKCMADISVARGKGLPSEKTAKPASESSMGSSGPDTSSSSAFSCDTVRRKIKIEGHAKEVFENATKSEVLALEKRRLSHGSPYSVYEYDEKHSMKKSKLSSIPITEFEPNVPIIQQQKEKLGADDRKRKNGDGATDRGKGGKLSHERKMKKSKSAPETCLEKPGAGNVNGRMFSQNNRGKSLCSSQLCTMSTLSDKACPSDSSKEDNLEILEALHKELAESPNCRNVEEKLCTPGKYSLEKKHSLKTEALPLVSLSRKIYLSGSNDSASKDSASDLEKIGCERTVSGLVDDCTPSPKARPLSSTPILPPGGHEYIRQRAVTSPSSEHKSTVSAVTPLRPNIYLYGLDILNSYENGPSVPKTERLDGEQACASSSATASPSVISEHSRVPAADNLSQPRKHRVSGELHTSKISSLAERGKVRHKGTQKKRKSTVEQEPKKPQRAAEDMETFSPQPVKGHCLTEDGEDDLGRGNLPQSAASSKAAQNRNHPKHKTDSSLKDSAQLTKSGKKLLQPKLQKYFMIKSPCSPDNATRSEVKSECTGDTRSSSLTKAAKVDSSEAHPFLTMQIKKEIEETQTFTPEDVKTPISVGRNVLGPNYKEPMKKIFDLISPACTVLNSNSTEACEIERALCINNKLVKESDIDRALNATVKVDVLQEDMIRRAGSSSKKNWLERGQEVGNKVSMSGNYSGVKTKGSTKIYGESSNEAFASNSAQQDLDIRSHQVFDRREKKSTQDVVVDLDIDETASQSVHIASFEPGRSSRPWPSSVPLSPSEGYQDKNAVHILVGHFTEVSREFGDYASALNHARPSCARQPTALVLKELLQLAQCERGDLQNLAFSYLMAWLELHPPVTPVMVQVYASVMGIQPSSSFLMDVLGAVNQSGHKGRKQLWTYVLSVFELNFSHCLQSESAKSVQGCLLVRWLWAHHRAVHHNQKSRQLLALVKDVLCQDSVCIADCLPICRLVGLVAECIRLACVEWNLRDPSFLKDSVLAIVHDLSRIFHDISLVSRPRFVYSLLLVLAPSWYRALMTATMLSSLNRYLIMDDINVGDLSLATIVSKFFFLLPHLENRGGDSAKFQKAKHNDLRKAEKPSTVLGQMQQVSNTKADQWKYTAAKVNKRNHVGESLVHKAAMKNDFKSMAKLLVVPGVNVNLRDNHGWTPLHEACNHGSLECVELLLKFVPPTTIDTFFPSSGEKVSGHVDLNSLSEDGITPLQDAVQQNHIEVCRLLLRYGGKRLLQAKTARGYTAVDLAWTKEMVNALTVSDQEHQRGMLNLSQDSQEGSEDNETVGETSMPLPTLYQEALQGGSKCASFSHCVSFLTLLALLLSSYSEAMYEGQTKAIWLQRDVGAVQNMKVHLRALKSHIKTITRGKDYIALKPYLLMVKAACVKFSHSGRIKNNS